MRRDRRWIASIGLLWLLAAAYLWQPLFGDGILFPANPRQWQPWATADPDWRQDGVASNRLAQDVLSLTYPWRTYNAELLRRGEIPFWNPYIFCGYPHLAALQSNALHPLTAPFDLWDPVAGMAWSLALHLGLAGTMMFFFLRRLEVGLGAATLGGVLFELNGFFLVRMAVGSYVFTGIWAPLVFLGFEDLLRGNGWRSSWKIVLATCFAFLGGHPQIFVLIMVTGAGYGLVAAWRDLRRLPPRILGGRFLKIALAGALGLGLAGIQLVPFLELMGESARQPVEYSSFQRLALPPVVLGQAVVPDLFGHPVTQNYWLHAAEDLVGGAPQAPRVWGWNYSGENFFTGVAPLVLALAALLRLRSRISLYFGAVAAVSLLVVFGAPGVSRLVYETVPTFQYARPDRLIYVFIIALCVLAPLGWAGATGWEDQRKPSPAASLCARALIVVPLTPAALQLLFDAERREGYRQFFALAQEKVRGQSDVLLPQGIEAAVVALATVGLLVSFRRWPRGRGVAWSMAVALIAIPLFRFGWRYNPVQQPPLFPESPELARLRQEVGDLDRIAHFGRDILPTNVGQSLGFFDVNGVSAAALTSYVQLIDAVDPGAMRKHKNFRYFTEPAVIDNPLLDFLGVELILADRPLPLPELKDLHAGLGFRVYRNPDRLPRFFLVDRVEVYTTRDQGIRRFLSLDFDRRSTALVESAAGLTSSAREATAESSVSLISYSPHEIELATRAASEKLLVTSEVDYPGWEVEIDGARAQKVLVNTAFRGVVVPEGEHQLRFYFVPRSFYLGAALTFLSFAVFVLSLVWTARARRRESGTR